MPQNEQPFTPGQLESLAKALGDTVDGLSGPEIAHALQKAKIPDIDSSNTKWKRLYNALVRRQSATGTGNCVINFIHYALEPARYTGEIEAFEQRCEAVNRVLALRGLHFTEQGKFAQIDRALTLDDAQRRASKLREKLQAREVHSDVLKFCTAELIQDNYFHTVLEAMKSIDAKIRDLTQLDLDGAGLYDRALSGSEPLLKINSLHNKSQRSEQSGFLNLLKGLYGTFRNPVAHEARIEWEMPEQDALDLLTTASYVHRRLDGARSI